MENTETINYLIIPLSYLKLNKNLAVSIIEKMISNKKEPIGSFSMQFKFWCFVCLISA